MELIYHVSYWHLTLLSRGAASRCILSNLCALRFSTLTPVHFLATRTYNSSGARAYFRDPRVTHVVSQPTRITPMGIVNHREVDDDGSLRRLSEVKESA